MLANFSTSNSEVPSSEEQLFVRYLWTYAIACFFLLSLVLAFNWCIDPYGIFHASRVPRINYYKPEMQSHGRIARAYQLALFQPDTVLFGTSRVEVGLSPKNIVWDRLSARCYNCGLSGANIHEIR